MSERGSPAANPVTPRSQGQAPANVYIVEAHAVVRRALFSRLNAADSILVAGAYSSIHTLGRALDALTPDPAARSNVTILVYSLPFGEVEKQPRSLAEIARLTAMGFALIVLAPYFVEEQRDQFIIAGASQFVLKEIGSLELILAIETLAERLRSEQARM